MRGSTTIVVPHGNRATLFLTSLGRLVGFKASLQLTNPDWSALQASACG